MQNSHEMEFTEKMYRSADLRQRWPSLTLKKLATGIDDSINASNPTISNKPEAMTDFPTPYWHISTRYGADGEEIINCVPCVSIFLNNGKYTRPYSVIKKENSKGHRYSFKRILFRKSDILVYEGRHTDEEGYFIFEEPEESIEVVVPQKLFAGKTPRGVVSAMSAPEYNFDPCVIAYVLHTWCAQTNMIGLGKALRRQGEYVTDSAYSKHARKLLELASNMDITYE